MSIAPSKPITAADLLEMPGKSIRQVQEGDELTAGDVLPGFRVPVSALFPPTNSAAKPANGGVR